MTMRLYLAPLLTVNSRHIFHDIGKYLDSCTSQEYTIKQITCRDMLTVDVPHDNVSVNASYAVMTDGAASHNYHVIKSELATFGCVRLTLERDYLGEFFSTEINNDGIRVNGLLTGGHLLFSDPDREHLGYELPCPKGDIIRIRRNRGLFSEGMYDWGEFGECGIVIRAIAANDEFAGSKVLLLRSAEYGRLTTERVTELCNIINSLDSVSYGVEDVGASIEEITDVWIVPKGFMPYKNQDFEPDPDNLKYFQLHLGNVSPVVIRSYRLGAPTEGIDTSVWSIKIPPFCRCVVGNNVTNIEIPDPVRSTKITLVSYWGVDGKLYAGLRCCGKYIDLAPSFSLGENLFSNSANSLSGKISTAVGILSSIISIGVGAYTQQPMAIAGGVSGLATTVGGAMGAVTTTAADGASGLQSIYTETVSNAESGFATSVPGGLSVTWYDVTNRGSIYDTINLYGVNCNTAITDKLSAFIRNNFQYVKFDNVDIESSRGYTAPPQFYKALQIALENGVWLWANTLNTPSPEMIWSGDFREDDYE